MRILVHICCGPCSIYPLKTMLNEKARFTGFFHNPNIHPLSEFKKRLDAIKTLARYLSIDIICDERYRPMDFIRGANSSSEGKSEKRPPKDIRCSYCLASRLEETAKAAVRDGFDAFSTSLLYSRYQNHEEIKRTGAGLSKRYGITFFYGDFRTGWQEGIDSSKSMGLYRQKYCGCIYSKIERYSHRKRAANG
ncbi:MAG: epoxyqueuosine reductase QueH [Deltaproteobacteria bacterium]|nr:epoxyqueuosine reductase QueH [Deltaproteobacteria bacterium]